MKITKSLLTIALLLVLTVFAFPTLAANKAGYVPVETRLERLERRIGRLTDLMLQVDQLKRENSELRGQIEVQNHAIEALKRRQRDLYIDIDSRLTAMQSSAESSESASTQVRAPAAMPTTAAAPAPTPSGSSTEVTPVNQATSTTSAEQAEYEQAFKLLSPSQKRYPEAIKALSAFLQKYPQSKLADNAQYWLAEANYVSQQNDVALVEFNKVVVLYPNSPKVSGALLKIGYLQHAAGNNAEAEKALKKVINNFPGSSAASMAEKRLKRIQQER